MQGAGFTLENSLFGAAKLSKNVNSEKNSYSRYGIVFDARGRFSLSDGSGHLRILIIKKDILILGKGQADVEDDPTLTSGK